MRELPLTGRPGVSKGLSPDKNLLQVQTESFLLPGQ